jgi:hypothetical protein
VLVCTVASTEPGWHSFEVKLKWSLSAHTKGWEAVQCFYSNYGGENIADENKAWKLASDMWLLILFSPIGKGGNLLCVLFRCLEKGGELIGRQRQTKLDTEGDLKFKKRKRLQMGSDPRGCRFHPRFGLVVGVCSLAGSALPSPPHWRREWEIWLAVLDLCPLAWLAFVKLVESLQPSKRLLQDPREQHYPNSETKWGWRRTTASTL